MTHYTVIERLPGATLVEVQLETGRTHQIRVHLSEAGHPVLGDSLYGRPARHRLVQKVSEALGHQALHARLLGFIHPITGKRWCCNGAAAGRFSAGAGRAPRPGSGKARGAAAAVGDLAVISYLNMGAPNEHSGQDRPAGEPLGSRPVPDRRGRLYVSPLLGELGVRHGFTTRLGGVSTGRFESLNLGRTWGDEPACADHNLNLVAADVGFAVAQLCQVIQVHGRAVLPLTAPERRQREADGMVTASDLVLGVLSADCVSILLADGEGRVAAVHAGWRGTVAGVASRSGRRA